MQPQNQSIRKKKSNPFRIRDFRKVNPDHIQRLESVGIKHASQMLAFGANPQLRAVVALMAEIPQSAILELVKLSDLSRLPGVKGIRSRLYYDAGVDSVEKMAACDPQELLSLTAEFVQQAGFEGVPPLPKEVISTIENAKKLPKIIAW